MCVGVKVGAGLKSAFVDLTIYRRQFNFNYNYGPNIVLGKGFCYGAPAAPSTGRSPTSASTSPPPPPTAPPPPPAPAPSTSYKTLLSAGGPCDQTAKGENTCWVLNDQLQLCTGNAGNVAGDVYIYNSRTNTYIYRLSTGKAALPSNNQVAKMCMTADGNLQWFNGVGNLYWQSSNPRGLNYKLWSDTATGNVYIGPIPGFYSTSTRVFM